MKAQIIKRLRNKAFLVTLSAALILLVKQLKPEIVPSNISEVVNSVLIILSIAGVIIDPTTPGIIDGKVDEK